MDRAMRRVDDEQKALIQYDLDLCDGIKPYTHPKLNRAAIEFLHGLYKKHPDFPPLVIDTESLFGSGLRCEGFYEFEFMNKKGESVMFCNHENEDSAWFPSYDDPLFESFPTAQELLSREDIIGRFIKNNQ